MPDRFGAGPDELAASTTTAYRMAAGCSYEQPATGLRPADKRRPEALCVIESPPDKILQRINNGQPAKVREAAEKLTAYAASLYDEPDSRPELGYLTARISWRLRALYPRAAHQDLFEMSGDITEEIVNEGYIEALGLLSASNAGKELDYIKDVAASSRTAWPSVLLFGVRVAGNPHSYSYLGGTDRALAAYIVKEKLRGIHRPGQKNRKFYKDRFTSEQSRLAYEMAEGLVQDWPVRTAEHGGLAEVGIQSDKGKVPASFCPARREFYQASAARTRFLLGYRILPADKSFQMVEDMATILLEDPEDSPLSIKNRYLFDQLLTEANQKNINVWAYVIEEMPEFADILAPVWEKSRHKLYAASLKRYRQMANPSAKRPRLQAWPCWQEELDRLRKISTKPQLRILYPPQALVKRPGDRGTGSTALEKRYGLRVPAEHENLINTLKKNPWFAANCDIVYNSARPYAPAEIAKSSLTEGYNPAKNYEIAGSWHIDRESRRGQITIFRAGFNNLQILAEELYHAVFDIILIADKPLNKKIQRFVRRYAPSRSAEEAFAKAMTSESNCRGSSWLPRDMVGLAMDIVKGRRSIPADAMERVARVKGSVASY